MSQSMKVSIKPLCLLCFEKHMSKCLKCAMSGRAGVLQNGNMVAGDSYYSIILRYIRTNEHMPCHHSTENGDINIHGGPSRCVTTYGIVLLGLVYTT